MDEHGFDEVDRRLLRTIIDKFGGGPVGLNSLAAAIGEEKDAIEDIYEPFLIQIGFLDRTPRGRVATARAYEYFGLTAPGKESSVVTAVDDAVQDRGALAATYVPPRVLTNADLEKMVETTDEWILQRTGIRERHIVDPGVGDVRHRASRRRSARSRRPASTPDDIGFIVVGTTTPDTIFPSTACPLQAKIGATPRVGLRSRRRLLGLHLRAHDRRTRWSRPARCEHALVVGADVMSSIIDYTDRSTCVLFGDGAGAAVVSPRADGEPAIIDFTHEIDGTGGPALCMPAGGSRRPASHETVDQRLHFVKQDGADGLQVRRRKTEEICRRLLERNDRHGRTTSTCSSRTRPTGASSRPAAERLGLAAEKVIINLEKYGNTTGGTIPLALADARRTAV